MPKPPIIPRTLVIPDVHQDVAWVRRILAAEAGAERVVFLGDYFDTSHPTRASVAETCEFLLGLRATLGSRVTFLLGNHDVQYLEAKSFIDAQRTPVFLKYKCGPAYSDAVARMFAQGLPQSFWDEARLFVRVGDWLLSHAGVAVCYWPAGESPEASLATLETRCREALKNLRGPANLLLGAGVCRGGDQARGGITWLDWDDEFSDHATPFAQIVGHTGRVGSARRNGRSWCIDGKQTTYAVIDGGALRIERA